MKRTERHHLKENELAHTLGRVNDVLSTRSREIGYAIVGLLLVAVAIGGYFFWRGRTEAAAGALLAEALTIAEAPVTPPAATPPPQPGATPPAPPAGSYPTEQAKLEAALPKFLDVVARYPSTDAGLTARYQAACTLSELGRTDDARTKYQEVIDRDGVGIYGQMARLGLANLEVAGGQFDRAITIYKELTADRETHLPVDGILMQLGHAYARAGKTSDAKQTFTRVVDEFPQSLYASQAKQELAKL
jgi:TolA-binding protein